MNIDSSPYVAEVIFSTLTEFETNPTPDQDRNSLERVSNLIDSIDTEWETDSDYTDVASSLSNPTIKSKIKSINPEIYQKLIDKVQSSLEQRRMSLEDRVNLREMIPLPNIFYPIIAGFLSFQSDARNILGILNYTIDHLKANPETFNRLINENRWDIRSVINYFERNDRGDKEWITRLKNHVTYFNIIKPLKIINPDLLTQYPNVKIFNIQGDNIIFNYGSRIDLFQSLDEKFQFAIIRGLEKRSKEGRYQRPLSTIEKSKKMLCDLALVLKNSADRENNRLSLETQNAWNRVNKKSQ